MLRIPRSMETCGRQPSALSLVVSRCTNGESPSHPRSPPVVTVSNSLQTEFLDDDVGQIQHVHELVVAKVEDVLEFFSVFNRVENTAATPSITSR